MESTMIEKPKNISTICVNIPAETKARANKILNDLGMNMSTAINVFLNQVIRKEGIPFELSTKRDEEDFYDNFPKELTVSSREELEERLRALDKELSEGNIKFEDFEDTKDFIRRS